MEEEKEKVYKCTLVGGCNFQSDLNTCQLAGSMCCYRKEEDSEENKKKTEKWFEKYYK